MERQLFSRQDMIDFADYASERKVAATLMGGTETLLTVWERENEEPPDENIEIEDQDGTSNYPDDFDHSNNY